jgi:hypothetical protein
MYQMNNFIELLFIVVLLFFVVGPIGFIRYKLYSRSIKAQESIAESLRKLAESQTKSH